MLLIKQRLVIPDFLVPINARVDFKFRNVQARATVLLPICYAKAQVNRQQTYFSR